MVIIVSALKERISLLTMLVKFTGYEVVSEHTSQKPMLFFRRISQLNAWLSVARSRNRE